MKCQLCNTEFDGRSKEGCPNCDQAKEFANTDEAFITSKIASVAMWHTWGQTQGGEEIMPGWVLNNRTLYNVNDPLSPLALNVIRDAFQIKTENRRPVMGDSDFNMPQTNVPAEMLKAKKNGDS